MIEIVTGRILGALVFVDATTSTAIQRPLLVSAADTTFVRNRRGLYAIIRSGVLPGYDLAYPSAPGEPPVGDRGLTVTVADPSKHYLSRVTDLRLPRDANPRHAARQNSVFRPVAVEMFPSSLASTGPGLAVLRAKVRRSGTDEGLRYAFIRVCRDGDPNDVLGRGLADGRGEAFVPIAGISTVNWSSDPDNPVLASSLRAVVAASYDSSSAGRLPNPTLLESRWRSLPGANAIVRLAPGREVFVSLEVTLP